MYTMKLIYEYRENIVGSCDRWKDSHENNGETTPLHSFIHFIMAGALPFEEAKTYAHICASCKFATVS